MTQYLFTGSKYGLKITFSRLQFFTEVLRFVGIDQLLFLNATVAMINLGIISLCTYQVCNQCRAFSEKTDKVFSMVKLV